MKQSQASLENGGKPPGHPLAVLWDESQFWGLMLVRTLLQLGYPFELLRSSEVARGRLSSSSFRALLVPGGWAAKKASTLGKSGLDAIRSFVRSGGWYVGFCGGAGFALSTGGPGSCLGLCPWGRKPMQDRLPNCSGHVYLRVADAGEFSLSAPSGRILAPVWWPSQFEPRPGPNQPRIVASYASPGNDFWVADLPLEQMNDEHLNSWEDLYNINLRPELIVDQPSIVGGGFGSGRYLLSYAHLETPASSQANAWLGNILNGLTTGKRQPNEAPAMMEWDLTVQDVRWEDPVLARSHDMLKEIVDQGRESFLLCWRKPWLLGWKRGIPGFSLNTLLAMVSQARSWEPGGETVPFWESRRDEFLGRLQEFKGLFQTLIREERFRRSRSSTKTAAWNDGEANSLKQRLVGPFPGQAGLFGALTPLLQELLWKQIREQTGRIRSRDDRD